MTVLTLVIGLAGNVTGVLLYASPVPIFWRILRQRSTEAFSGVPYVFGVLSTMQWAYFGLLRGPHARPLVSLTSIGCALQLAFNSIYLRFASRSQRVLQTVLLLVGLSLYVTMVTLTTILLSGHVRANAVGIICAVNSICFSASPLLILKRVIKTRSVEFMPFYLPLFMFLSAADWSLFAWLTRDVILAVPNCVNVVLGGTQLILYAYYKLIEGGSRHNSTRRESINNTSSSSSSSSGGGGGDDADGGGTTSISSQSSPQQGIELSHNEYTCHISHTNNNSNADSIK